MVRVGGPKIKQKFVAEIKFARDHPIRCSIVSLPEEGTQEGCRCIVILRVQKTGDTFLQELKWNVWRFVPDNVILDQR